MKVPVYDQHVKARGLPDTKQSLNRLSADASSFGAGYARDIGALGSQVEGLGLKVLDSTNKAQVRDALNSARTESREYMNKVKTLKGKDAIGAYKNAGAEFKEMQKRASENLQNPAQQKMFEGVFTQMSHQNLNTVLGHQTREEYNYKIATLDAENENELQDAIAKIDTNPEDIPGHLALITANTRTKYAHMGAEVVKSATRDAKSSFHLTVANAMSDDDVKGALKYLYSNKDAINSTAYKGMVSSLKSENIRNISHDKALTIHSGPGTYTEKLAKARKLDGEVADRVESKLTRWHAQEERENREVEEKKMFEFNQEVAKSGSKVTYDVIEKNVKGMGLSGPAERQMLSNWGKALGARDDKTKLAQFEQEGVELYDQLSKLSQLNPSAFAGIKLPQYYAMLGKERFNTLHGKQMRITDPNAKTPQSVAAKRVDDAVDGALKIHSQLNPISKIEKLEGGWTTSAAEVQNTAIRKRINDSAALENYIREQVNALSEERRTDDAINKIVSNAFLNVDVDAGVLTSGQTVPRYLADAEIKRQGAKFFTPTDEARERLSAEYGISEDAAYDPATKTFSERDEAEIKRMAAGTWWGRELTVKGIDDIKSVQLGWTGQPLSITSDSQVFDVRYDESGWKLKPRAKTGTYKNALRRSGKFPRSRALINAKRNGGL